VIRTSSGVEESGAEGRRRHFKSSANEEGGPKGRVDGARFREGFGERFSREIALSKTIED